MFSWYLLFAVFYWTQLFQHVLKIRHTQRAEEVAEGYKPLLDELRVEIGNLDPVTATEQ
jgi:hypothetical protein